jgi:hypothetical protein
MQNSGDNDPCPEPNMNKPNLTELGSSICLAKYNYGTSFAVGENGSDVMGDLTDNFTLTIGTDSSQGTWEYHAGTEDYDLTHIILKAGNEFSLYELVGETSGDWMTAPYLTSGSGAGRSISHISFYGVAGGGETAVPLPAPGLLMMAGFMGLASLRLRKKR